MLTSWKRAFQTHVTANFKTYLWIGIGYLLSIALGAIFANYLQAGIFETLSNYVEDLFQFVQGESLSLWAVFTSAMRGNLSFLLFLWIFGFTIVGLPLIAAFVFYKGLSFGFTAALVIRLFGWHGIVLVVLLFIAQALLAVPAYFFSACNAVKMSTYLFRFFGGKKLQHNSFSSSFFVYTLSFLLPILLLTLDALYGAYVLPPAFRFYLSLFP